MSKLPPHTVTEYSGTLRTGFLAMAIAFFPVGALRADDWMTWASTYTHDPSTGQRVDQYAQPVQPLGPVRSSVKRSGYRNYRSTLQTGQSSDNMHVVEQWGRQVIPYEQWRFPYRPYAVPYNAWGPQAPYGILNGQIGFGGYGGAAQPNYNRPPVGQPPVGGATQPGPGYGPRSPYVPPRGFPLQPEYRNQPWYDGNYPSAPPLDPRSDQEFFNHPRLGRPTN